MLIYRLLGEDAEASFARSFGVSYGIGAAQEARARCCVLAADLLRVLLTRCAAHGFAVEGFVR